MQNNFLKPLLMHQVSFEDVSFIHKISSDQALKRVGGHHLFQILLLIIVALTFNSPFIIAMSLPYFTSKHLVNLDCQFADHTSLCNPDQACSSDVTAFNYIHDPDVTLVNWIVDFKLACWNKHYLGLLGTSYFGGFLLGSFFMMAFGDHIRRKVLIVIGLAMHLICNVAIFFVTSPGYLYFYMTIVGLRTPFSGHLAYVLMIELIDSYYRPLFGLINSGFNGGSVLIIAIAFKYLQDWKKFMIINTVQVGLMLVLVILFVPESPRYFLSKGKYTQAKLVYQYIARINRKPMFSEGLEGEEDAESSMRTSTSMNNRARPSILDGLWRTKTHRQRCLLFFYPYAWLVVDVVSYGVVFALNQLDGDTYTYGMIVGVASLCGSLGSIAIANHCGRKIAYFITWGCAALGCFVYQFSPNIKWLLYIMIFFTKYGAQGSFGMSLLLTSQYFPTVYRGFAFGLCNVFARIGGLISPQFSTVFFPESFMLAFGVLALSVFCLTFLIYETKGQKMPDLASSKQDN